MPGAKRRDVIGMREPLAKHVWPNAERLAATGVQLGGLKWRENSGLSQRIDPDRLELGQVPRQSPHPPAHLRHLGGRGQPQAFQHGDKLCRWLLSHHDPSVLLDLLLLGTVPIFVSAKMGLSPSTLKIRTGPFVAVAVELLSSVGVAVELSPLPKRAPAWRAFSPHPTRCAREKRRVPVRAKRPCAAMTYRQSDQISGKHC